VSGVKIFSGFCFICFGYYRLTGFAEESGPTGMNEAGYGGFAFWAGVAFFAVNR
jgi:hypothetical protein